LSKGQGEIDFYSDKVLFQGTVLRAYELNVTSEDYRNNNKKTKNVTRRSRYWYLQIFDCFS